MCVVPNLVVGCFPLDQPAFHGIDESRQRGPVGPSQRVAQRMQGLWVDIWERFQEQHRPLLKPER